MRRGTAKKHAPESGLIGSVCHSGGALLASSKAPKRTSRAAWSGISLLPKLAMRSMLRRGKKRRPRVKDYVGAIDQGTTMVWDRKTGKPVAHAIVWQDTRVADDVKRFSATGGQDRFRPETGLPLSTYFSGLKLRWLLENVPGGRAKAAAGELLFGNVDTFLLWNLTGGARGGVHATDVTNASRTQLLNIKTLDWDEKLLAAFEVPRGMLPEVRSSSEIYGEASLAAIAGVPVAGILGDQQAALVGQACFRAGEVKNTYGTGCFLLMNTGERMVPSSFGLLTTLAYKFGNAPAHYALEGSVAIAGALVQWLRDNLGIIAKSPDVEVLARTVNDNGGVYFVPAF